MPISRQIRSNITSPGRGLVNRPSELLAIEFLRIVKGAHAALPDIALGLDGPVDGARCDSLFSPARSCGWAVRRRARRSAGIA